MHIIHVIPNASGGGAERIAQDLTTNPPGTGVTVERVCFTGRQGQDSATTCFGLAHNSPMVVPRLRALIKARLTQHHHLIVHSHLTHGFYATLIATAGLPVRWVHTEHNTTMRLRRIKAFHPLERWAYLQCDQVIAVSHGVKQALAETLKLTDPLVTVIPNGAQCFPAVKRAPLADRAIRLLSIGSLNRRKGFDTMLAALAKAKIRSWRYTIVGTGCECEALRVQAQALGIAKHVTFAGYVTNPQPHYQAADVLLIPSRWEGFGLVAVEAMSTGLPVLASCVSGLKEVLGQTAGTLQVGDHENPAAWARALETQVTKMRARGIPDYPETIKRASQFSIDAMVDGYRQMYARMGVPAGTTQAPILKAIDYSRVE